MTATGIVVEANRIAETIVLAWTRVTRNIGLLTVSTSIALLTFTLVISISINTTAMHTGIIVKLAVALVHVQVAVRPVESRFTGASVAVPQGGTCGPVSAGLAGTVVPLFAGWSFPSSRAATGVSIQGGEMTTAPISAWTSVTNIFHTDLAQRGLESHRTGTLKLWRLVTAGKDKVTCSAVQTFIFSGCTGVSMLAEFTNKSSRAIAI